MDMQSCRHAVMLSCSPAANHWTIGLIDGLRHALSAFLDPGVDCTSREVLQVHTKHHRTSSSVGGLGLAAKLMRIACRDDAIACENSSLCSTMNRARINAHILTSSVHAMHTIRHPQCLQHTQSDVHSAFPHTVRTSTVLPTITIHRSTVFVIHTLQTSTMLQHT